MLDHALAINGSGRCAAGLAEWSEERPLSWMLQAQLLPCVPAGWEGPSRLTTGMVQPGVRGKPLTWNSLSDPPLEQLPCSRHEAVHVITLFVQPC